METFLLAWYTMASCVDRIGLLKVLLQAAFAIHAHAHAQCCQVGYRLAAVAAKRCAQQPHHAAFRGFQPGVAVTVQALHAPRLHRTDQLK